MKKLVCGCFGTIYYAKILKNGLMSYSDRVDVTDDAINAVIQHIMNMTEYKKNNGFSGYVYKKTDGGKITICVFDNDTHKIVGEKSEEVPEITEAEFESDTKFMTHIVQEICAYAHENGLEQNDTIKTIGENLIALTEVADFSHNTGEENVGDE